jgi:hypothetical protein
MGDYIIKFKKLAYRESTYEELMTSLKLCFMVPCVMGNSDLVTVIFSSSNITQGRDYKAIITTCRLWHDTVASPKRAHMYMNALATYVTRHPFKRYRWDYVLPYITLDLSDKILSDLGDDITLCVARNPRINESFIEKYKDHPGWHWLSFFSNHNISMELAEKYIEHYPISEVHSPLMYNKNLTVDFLRKHKELINWEEVCDHPCLTEEFIYENWDNMCFGELARNPSLSQAFICKHIDLFIPIQQLYSNPRFYDQIVIVPHLTRNDWYEISQNRALTDEFIRENWANLNLYEIVTWCKLEFIERYIGETSDNTILPWYEINVNPHINIEFIDKYFNYLSTHSIGRHAITIDFLESHSFKGGLYK